MKSIFTLLAPLVAVAFAAGAPAMAQPVESRAAQMSFADMVDLADGTPLVLRAQIKDQALVEPERSPGLAPGFARLYIEARTSALITGTVPMGESLRYLVDVPLDAKGKVPKLKKQEVMLFARPVPGRPGQLQLVDPTAQFLYDPGFEARLRPVLSALLAQDAPPVVTGIRDALTVEGTLVGESETQLFLDTRGDGPVSVTIVRRPNQAPRWGVSWTEIVDQSARAPQPGTLAWYRLACALPERLPSDASLARDSRVRAITARDYAFMLEQLGPCTRNRG
ncbi:hypothetical protein [Qipengyuania marisflavi]|uniref:DUF3108 domain-containing protein n=1 Tax=Qipengyuania marisflavi TaxID=2486356 RepID=A0A5S3P4Y9_9SPHN|nr:hypothetical protein [Qipengyuania marisflavi]TMM48102.1 hypothetical protein FEV51_07295 [Qipengyuania marisflavi]